MLSLPDTPAFRNLLSSLTVTTGEGDLQVSSKTQGITANREVIIYPALFLNSSQTDDCKLSVLTRKLRDSWKDTQHPSTTRLAELALAVFAVLKAGYLDSFTLFNRLLESTVPVDVSHFMVFPAKAEDGNLGQFAGFRFGDVQNLSLQHRSKRANSDYYNLVRERIRHRHCLESPIYKRAVMGFLDLSWQAPSMRAIPSELLRQVLLNYYEELSTYYTEWMWQDLDDRQSIGAAAGFEAFDVPSLKKDIPGSVSVTIYLNQTPHRWDGYVVPLEHGIYSNTWSGRPPILQSLEAYQAGLEFPTSPTLAQVSRYGVRARRASRQSELAEALLNYTIALEMLFSEKNQTSQAISRRLAVLISDPNPVSYISSKKKILSLYDTRSQYVHAGVQPVQDIVEAMSSIFESVLAVLIRLERQKILHTKESFAHWIRLLDWIASGYEADQIPTHAVQVEIGLKTSTA